MLLLLTLCLVALGCRPSTDREWAALPAIPTAAPTPVPLSAAAPTPSTETDALAKAGVVIGGVRFEAELAVSPAHRARGLSGRDSLTPKTGMLFVFEDSIASSFWMNEMRFPLDFVWIGEDCTVVDVTANVPVPALGTEQAELPTYSSGAPAAYNFEINAGEADEYGVAVGSPVRIYGMPPGIESPCG